MTHLSTDALYREWRRLYRLARSAESKGQSGVEYREAIQPIKAELTRRGDPRLLAWTGAA